MRLRDDVDLHRSSGAYSRVQGWRNIDQRDGDTGTVRYSSKQCSRSLDGTARTRTSAVGTNCGSKSFFNLFGPALGALTDIEKYSYCPDKI